ncbi:hypothetical protein CHU98_g5562 [Xylaria longipes]|nr:hypothetical protein CHU98_g5562 [Xylaria longipes]
MQFKASHLSTYTAVQMDLGIYLIFLALIQPWVLRVITTVNPQPRAFKSAIDMAGGRDWVWQLADRSGFYSVYDKSNYLGILRDLSDQLKFLVPIISSS